MAPSAARRVLAIAALVVAVGAVAAVAACSGDSPSQPGSTSPVGSWAVATVNAKAPPVAIFADTNFTEELVSGILALTGDGKYTTIMTTRWTVPNNVSTYVDTTGGRWVLSGTTIQFTNAQDSSQDQATWTNGHITFVEVDGKTTNTYVYARQP